SQLQARHPLSFAASQRLFKSREKKRASRWLPARDLQEREQGCKCNAYQRPHLLVAGRHRLRECPWLPPVKLMERVQKLFPGAKELLHGIGVGICNHGHKRRASGTRPDCLRLKLGPVATCPQPLTPKCLGSRQPPILIGLTMKI